MFIEIFPKLVNLLASLVLGMAFLLIARGDLRGQVKLFAAQSFFLSLLAALISVFTLSAELFAVAAGLVIIKVVAVPAILNRAVSRIGLQRAVAPYLGAPAALVISGLLVVIAFYVMAPVTAANPLPTAGAVPLAFAGMLIGAFITVIRRRALTQILGFLMLENSIFLLALLATYGVPFIVEIGVFLDVLVAVLIMEVFIYRIKENFDSIEAKELRRLKG
ncbi:MAG: hydrogenase [Acidobacteriota bacterium]